jgi:hypothetical protein
MYGGRWASGSDSVSADRALERAAGGGDVGEERVTGGTNARP